MIKTTTTQDNAFTDEKIEQMRSNLKADETMIINESKTSVEIQRPVKWHSKVLAVGGIIAASPIILAVGAFQLIGGLFGRQPKTYTWTRKNETHSFKF